MYAGFLFEAIEGPVRLELKVGVFLKLSSGGTFIRVPLYTHQYTVERALTKGRLT